MFKSNIREEKQLKYIFISHFEYDEYGGQSVLLKHFPGAKPICSSETASQLSGFGITKDSIVKKPGEKMMLSNCQFEFIGYPSEMHLWEGLLLIENKRGIFFSSDLVFCFGKANGAVIEGNWQSEIENIAPFQIPNSEQRTLVKKALSQLNPKFAATGHGPCVKF